LAADPDFRNNRDRVAHRDVVDARVQAHLAKMTREEATTLLDRARIAYGRLSDMSDVAAHPQSHFTRVMTPGGPLELLSPAAVVAGAPDQELGPVPDLDEQGAAIRAEFARGS
jgi:crotonobetainyl-CoA:carnitine CoA-transferase CaiB-like acyl-CoA transferase